MAYATATRGRNRRPKRPAFDPLREQAKLVADELWERAKKIAKVLAPEVPTDMEPMEDSDMWLFLETFALRMAPEFWEDPEMINDLYRLRGQFAPRVPREHLKEIERAVRVSQRALPDVEISPASPEYDDMMNRMKR